MAARAQKSVPAPARERQGRDISAASSAFGEGPQGPDERKGECPLIYDMDATIEGDPWRPGDGPGRAAAIELSKNGGNTS